MIVPFGIMIVLSIAAFFIANEASKRFEEKGGTSKIYMDCTFMKKHGVILKVQNLSRCNHHSPKQSNT
jgi:hypothetical protein